MAKKDKQTETACNYGIRINDTLQVSAARNVTNVSAELRLLVNCANIEHVRCSAAMNNSVTCASRQFRYR